MRFRWATLATLVMALLATAAIPAAASSGSLFAQPAGDDTETGDDDSGTIEEGETEIGEESEEGTGSDEEPAEGQSDPEAESGAGEEETGEAVTETGPPWTYQMARIILILLAALLLAIGWLYYRLVASRQKGAA